MSDEVLNPMRLAVVQLVTRTENAVSGVPNLDGPAGTIGPGPAWTGPTARAEHDAELAPLVEPVRQALNNLVADVEARRDEMDERVDQGVANAMQADLNSR